MVATGEVAKGPPSAGTDGPVGDAAGVAVLEGGEDAVEVLEHRGHGQALRGKDRGVGCGASEGAGGGGTGDPGHPGLTMGSKVLLPSGNPGSGLGGGIDGMSEVACADPRSKTNKHQREGSFRTLTL